MARNTKVTFRAGECSALSAQNSGIYPYGFPFTLNPTMGCFFSCKYCYSPITTRKLIENKRDGFFEEVTVRLGVPAQLKKELAKFSVLPQHLKRVQINEHSDYYLPQVFSEMKIQNQPDTLLEILEIFYDEWNKGNQWMLHILTKSHLILKHLDQLKKMDNMVQVEISFSTEDETKRKELELYSPSIQKRFDTIETLSKAGVFVRIMAMPFYGNETDLLKLKNEAFTYGAKALKNKGLNYYSWQDVKNISEQDLLDGKLLQSGSRKDTPIDSSLNTLSGEVYLNNGKAEDIDVLMPSHKAWTAMSMLSQRLTLTRLKKINCGYAQLNSVDWGYII